MKLIKISNDSVQIKTDSKHLKNLRINDLLLLSDADVSIVCNVVGLTGNDSMDIYDYDNELLGQTDSNNTIDCGIIGSIVNGKFTKSIDIYPSTSVEISVIEDERFAQMISSKSGFKIGNFTNYDTEAMIDGNKLLQRHFAIVGSTGCGKSVTTTSLLEKLSGLKSSNVILFDLHGEYQGLDFVETVKIGNDGLAFPLWFMPFKDIYSNILRLKEESATIQLAGLRSAFYKARNSDKTDDIPVAFRIEDMRHDLQQKNEDMIGTGEFYKTGARQGLEKEVKGENYGKLNSVLALLYDKITDSRYDFMTEDEPQEYLYEFVEKVYGIGESNIKAIDLSDVPSDIAPVIIAVITKLLYNIQRQQLKNDIHPICFICEEAHVYIPSSDFGIGASQRRMLEVFETIAKEGRKFGTTLGLVSQRPSELNKTIMAQCANFIVMKMTNESDKAKIKGVLPESSRDIIDALSLFSPGDCLIIGDSVDITAKIKIDMPSQMPNSSTINTWDMWDKKFEQDCGTLVDKLLEKGE